MSTFILQVHFRKTEVLFFNAFSDFPLMRKMYFQGQALHYMLETEGFDIAMITLTILSKSSTVSSPFAS